MRLKVGDRIYLKPEKASKLSMDKYDVDIEKWPNIKDMPFLVTGVREKTPYQEDDICINWIDNTNWWWGQIGSTEPWTVLFISELEYNRNRKLELLGI